MRIRTWMFAPILLLISTYLAPKAMSQSVLDEIQSDQDTSGPSSLEVFNEKIIKISASKRIFILSNDAHGFSKGDFVSLLTGQQLVLRALVAKDQEGQSGIKILKIYSVDLWNKLRSGSNVQVIRGDDSFYKKNPGALASNQSTSKIDSEADLFNDTSLNDDDLSLEDKSKRLIKTDNIVTVTYGQIEGVDNDHSSTRYAQPGIQWSYQIADNIWGELGYGENVVKDFPSSGLDTKVTNITLRAKYTISAPFNSFVKPYVGYQIIKADSPGAGFDAKGEETTENLNKEIELVESINKNSIIFGATLLKRLVPGWFAKIDLGTDIMSFGFGLEF